MVEDDGGQNLVWTAENVRFQCAGCLVSAAQGRYLTAFAEVEGSDKSSKSGNIFLMGLLH